MTELSERLATLKNTIYRLMSCEAHTHDNKSAKIPNMVAAWELPGDQKSRGVDKRSSIKQLSPPTTG